jgi:hypothetical protein
MKGDIEMPLARTWAKSSYSDPNGGNCVEARRLGSGAVQVRDSKNPDGPELSFSDDCWQEFVASAQGGGPDGAALIAGC